MKIGLACYESRNNDIGFNARQIERAMREAKGKVDLLCFGEAFLQGFDSLSWNYDADKDIAVTIRSPVMDQLRRCTELYRTALLAGYLEREGENIYSSCAVLENGETLCNYKRVTKGWKDYHRTDRHYREGNDIHEFNLRGHTFQLALCGDLWDEGWERFRTGSPLIWPVYTDYSIEEWEKSEISAYAEQASKLSGDVLMVNSICHRPLNNGGAFHFHDGKVLSRLPFSCEGIMIVELSDA